MGNAVFMITTIRDVSHWREIDNQKHQLHLKSLAFASTAHEFRNPLGSVLQSLELLEPSIKEPQQKYFLNAQNCLNLILFLVNDILDFAQIEEKKIVINMNQTVNLSQIIQECIAILRFKATMKRIELSSQVSEGFPHEIGLDGNRTK